MGRVGISASAVSTPLRSGRIPRRPTMLTTALCRQLGIEHPILNAPMGGGIAGPELAAAVSNAGGLGTLGLGALPPQFIGEQIRRPRPLTGKPFLANLVVATLRGGEIPPSLLAPISLPH